MAYKQIPNLPAAIALNGAEELEAVQAGTSVRTTTGQIASLAGPAPTVLLNVPPGTVLGRFIGAGTGIAQNLPIAVDTSGNVGIGTSAPASKLQVNPSSTSGSNFYVADYDTGSGGANRNTYVAIDNYSNDAYGDGFAGRYARGTSASPSAVQNGDILTYFYTSGYDGSAFRSRAEINFPVDGAVSANNVPTAIKFVTGSTSAAERMRIDSAGNVGIGTSSPATKLQVNPSSASGSNFRIEDYDSGSGGANRAVISITEAYNNDTYGDGFAAHYARGTAASPLAIQSGDVTGYFYGRGYDGTSFKTFSWMEFPVDGAVSTGVMPLAIKFSTGSSSAAERMRITSGGNVGIGTSAPGGYRLMVNGPTGSPQIVATDGTVEVAAGYCAGSNVAYAGTLTNHPYEILSNNSVRIAVTAAGNVGIGTLSPVNKLQIVGSFGRGAPVTKTADFTLADTENWVINNKSGSSCTVTLPAASSWTGREVMFKTIQAQTLVSASSNVVPLAGGSAGTAILAGTAGAWATLVSDGTDWVIMAGS